MTVNSALRDEHIRHALHVQKFGRGEAEKIVKLLNASDEALIETIAKRVAMIEERGYDRGPATTKRLQLQTTFIQVALIEIGDLQLTTR